MKRFVHCTHCNMLNGVDDSVRDGGTVFCKRCKKKFTFHSDDAHRISRKTRLICQYCGYEAEYDEYYMNLMDNRPKCFECSNEIVTDEEEQKRLRRIKEENNAAIEAKKERLATKESPVEHENASNKRPCAKVGMEEIIGNIFLWCMLFAVVASVIYGCFRCVRYFLSEERQQAKIAAIKEEELHKERKVVWEAAKNYALVFIQTPRTARFPYIDVDKYVSEVSDGVFKVSAYVDYQNTFGATVRSYFTATVTRESGYKVTDFSVN